MNTRIVIPLLCAGALAFACGPRPHSDATSARTLARTSAKHTAAAGAGASRGTSARAGRADEARLSSRFGVQMVGSELLFALDVTNVGSRHVELTFPNGQAYDFAIVDSTGREVWRWTRGRLFTQALQNKLLDAGESMRVDERWKVAGHGRYTAIATLNSVNYPLEERVDFALP